ncbi:transcription antiterminator [Aerococcus viridans]|uniref:Transcription antiterminator n=1 Tax=Aerococcus viridans TaxID=1377 RepID=A0A2N6UG86_9LACT|nr:PRD domain-containing protein [Aerococcus viridans]PMC80621.1 transcription antiterminator [Aerococcus viridans]
MNKTDERKDAIILILSNNTDFVTAGELAESLEVSEKTIYRTVKEINNDEKIPLEITSEKGKGYKITHINKISTPVSEVNDIANMTPAQRRNNIMQDLLISSPNERKIPVLYEDFFISDNLIRLDIKLMEKTIAQMNLKLIRDGQLLKIIGKEKDLRKAIGKLFQQNHLYVESLENNIEDNLFDSDIATFVLKQINIIEKRLNSILPYPYNINIFSHIYILVKRYQATDEVNFSYDMEISKSEEEEMAEYRSIYNVVREITSNLERFLNKEIPKEEEYFLFQYLISSRFQGEFEKDQLADKKVLQVVDYYIEKTSQYLNFNIESSKLRNNLYHHVKPFLNRLNNGFYVKNPLLDQIKYEYQMIFDAVQNTSVEMSKLFNLSEINEDEIGFIALYFAQYLEENPKYIDVLIVCTSGIGTSELLKSKISQKFKNINIVDVISTKQLYENPDTYQNIDLIISTVKFKETVRVPNIVISAMLTFDDQDRINSIIEDLGYE